MKKTRCLCFTLIVTLIIMSLTGCGTLINHSSQIDITRSSTRSNFSLAELQAAKISAQHYLDETYTERTFEVKIIIMGPGSGPFAHYSIDAYALDNTGMVYWGYPVTDTVWNFSEENDYISQPIQEWWQTVSDEAP